MHFARKDAINANLSIFEDTLGGCERLLSSPVPLFYSRHTARFLATWLLLLPLGLYAPFGGSWNHWAMVPAMAIISVMLFGIEELATQLEVSARLIHCYCNKESTLTSCMGMHVSFVGTVYHPTHAGVLR